MRRIHAALVGGGLAVLLAATAPPAHAGGKVAVLGVEGDQSGAVEDALTSIVEDEHEVVSAQAFERAADKAGVKELDTRGIAKVAKKLDVAAVLESVMQQGDDGYQLLVRVRAATGKTTKKLTVTMPDRKLTASAKKSLGSRVLAALDEIDPRSGRARNDEVLAGEDHATHKRARTGRLDDGEALADGGDADADADAGADGDADAPRGRHKAAKGKKAKKHADRAARDDRDDGAGDDGDDGAARDRGDARDDRADAGADDDDAPRGRGKASRKAEKVARRGHDRADDRADDRAARDDRADDRDARDRRAARDDDRGPREVAVDRAHRDDDRRADRADDDRDHDRTRGASDKDLVAMRDDDDARASSRDDDDDRPRRRGDADDADDGVASSVLLRRGDGAPLQAAIVEAGASVTGRTLSFVSRTDFTQAPKGYKGPMVPGAHVDGVIYPFAFADPSSPAAGLGVDFEYDQVVSLTTRTTAAMGVTMPTAEKHWNVGARYRFAFGHTATSAQVAVGFDLGRRSFVIDRTPLPSGVTLDIPDVDYQYYAPELAVRLPLGGRVTLTADGRALLVKSAGSIQSQAQYGAAKVSGGEGSAGLEIVITPRVMLHVTGSAAMIGYAFVGNGQMSNGRDGDPTTKDVGGAKDIYLGGAAMLGVTY